MSFFKKYGWVYPVLIVAATVTALLISGAGSAVAVLGREEPVYPTVVIDAGHGGEDGGTVSVSGLRESGLNLEIALRLNDMLHLLGQQTVMVRTQDISVHSSDAVSVAQKKVSDIRNRVALVNEAPQALLVSIHQNHFPESKYRGAQVFYAGTSGSETLATLLQDTLRSQIDPGNRRQCKAAQDIYLLSHVDCTAVLVECGFLSNPQEERLLRDGLYQKKLAAVIGCCVGNYLEGNDEI